MRKGILPLLFFVILAWVLFFVSRPVSAEVVDRIVAIVNSDIITQSELLDRLDPIYKQYSSVYQGKELAKKMTEARRDILGQLIEDRLILQKALEMGLKVSDEDIELQIREVKAKFDTEEAFDQAIEEQGLSLDALREKYTDQRLIRQLIGMEVRSRVVVTPKEIQDYYLVHQDDFKSPERVRAKMILIRVSKEEREEIAAQAEMVGGAEEPSEAASATFKKVEDVQKLLIAGTLFEDVCREYSEGPNVEKGCDLGFVEQGEMVEEVDHILFALKVGEVSRAVKTRVGYHFFKVDARQEELVPDFQEVREQAENLIYQERFGIVLVEWVDKLKDDAFISIK